MNTITTDRTKRIRDEARRTQDEQIKDRIDEASDESFPASDPPAWSPLLARPPAVATDMTEASSAGELHAVGDNSLKGGQFLEGLFLVLFMLGVMVYLSIFCWFVAGF